MTSASLWNQTVAPMYTQPPPPPPPRRQIKQVTEEPTRNLETWCAEAKGNANWEAMAWIAEQHRRIHEPVDLDHCQDTKRTLMEVLQVVGQHGQGISLWDIHDMPTRSKFTFFPVFLNF